MANARAANVWIIDTNAAFDERVQIEQIVLEGTSPTLVIRKGSSSGTVIYSRSGATTAPDQVCIRSTQGIHVTLGGTAPKAYLYLK